MYSELQLTIEVCVCVGGCFTHFLLLLLPGWIEQSFSFPLLFLFHVVVHRVVISILVHGCWHNPPTADRQRRLRRRSKRRDVDRDRWLRPANDLPTSLLLLLQALPASLPSNSGVQQPGCGWRSFLAAAPPSPVLLSTGQLAVICVSAMKEFSGEERRSWSACGCWDAGDEGCCCCCCKRQL